jgi:hypothetical protein
VTEPAGQSPPPSPLEYASPQEGQLSGARMAFQAVLSCALTCGLLMGTVFFGLLFGLAGRNGATYATLAIVAGIGILAGFVAIAIAFQRQPRRRGLALGIWLGIGMAALLEGLCFAGMMF